MDFWLREKKWRKWDDTLLFVFFTRRGKITNNCLSFASWSLFDDARRSCVRLFFASRQPRQGWDSRFSLIQHFTPPPHTHPPLQQTPSTLKKGQSTTALQVSDAASVRHSGKMHSLDEVAVSVLGINIHTVSCIRGSEKTKEIYSVLRNASKKYCYWLEMEFGK